MSHFKKNNYSILVDEVTDAVVQEQLGIYAGYVDLHGETSCRLRSQTWAILMS